MPAPKERDFRNLKVWEKSHELALLCYRSTTTFPNNEVFGLTSQIKRSASSVPANIAEGCGRGGKDLARFCGIAYGSLSELQYHLILAHDLEFLNSDASRELGTRIEVLRRMLSSFIASLADDE